MKVGRGQKHLSEAKICMKESIYGKKCLMKVSQQPQNPKTPKPQNPVVCIFEFMR